MADALNPFFAEYTSELVKAARRSRQATADRRLPRGRERTRPPSSRSSSHDRWTGCCSPAPSPGSTAAALCQAAGIPTVLIDCPGPVPGRRTVGHRRRRRAEMLVNHLVEHGRRRIGLVVGDHGFGDPDPRERGWRRALRAAGLADGPIVRVPFSREGGLRRRARAAGPGSRRRRGLRQQRPAGRRPACAPLHERGVRIPEDVAVVTFDGTKESEFCWPPLTGCPAAAARAGRGRDLP